MPSQRVRLHKPTQHIIMIMPSMMHERCAFKSNCWQTDAPSAWTMQQPLCTSNKQNMFLQTVQALTYFGAISRSASKSLARKRNVESAPKPWSNLQDLAKDVVDTWAPPLLSSWRDTIHTEQEEMSTNTTCTAEKRDTHQACIKSKLYMYKVKKKQGTSWKGHGTKFMYHYFISREDSVHCLQCILVQGVLGFGAEIGMLSPWQGQGKCYWPVWS